MEDQRTYRYGQRTDSFVDENTLTVNVARLRRKLESCGLEGFIVTKKGLGYLVEA